MQSKAKTVQEYIEKLDSTQKPLLEKLRKIILENIPENYEECMSYGMIGFVVPLSYYPKGYHCDTSLPLPFVSIAAQKNYLAFYHMGLYANQDLLKWFTEEYTKTGLKLDMGKSCVRFKYKEDLIPFDLIGKLMRKIKIDDYISNYEKSIGRR